MRGLAKAGLLIAPFFASAIDIVDDVSISEYTPIVKVSTGSDGASIVNFPGGAAGDSSVANINFLTSKDQSPDDEFLKFQVEILPSEQICGYGNVLLNGQKLAQNSKDAISSGKGPITTGLSKPIVASWNFECLTLDNEQMAQLLRFNVEDIAGESVENIGFTLSFKQTGTTEIIRIESGISHDGATNWLEGGRDEHDHEEFQGKEGSREFNFEEEIMELDSLRAEVAHLMHVIDHKEHALEAHRMANTDDDIGDDIKQCDSLKCVLRLTLDKARGAAHVVYGKISGEGFFDEDFEGGPPPHGPDDHPPPHFGDRRPHRQPPHGEPFDDPKEPPRHGNSTHPPPPRFDRPSTPPPPHHGPPPPPPHHGPPPPPPHHGPPPPPPHHGQPPPFDDEEDFHGPPHHGSQHHGPPPPFDDEEGFHGPPHHGPPPPFDDEEDFHGPPHHGPPPPFDDEEDFRGPPHHHHWSPSHPVDPEDRPHRDHGPPPPNGKHGAPPNENHGPPPPPDVEEDKPHHSFPDEQPEANAAEDSTPPSTPTDLPVKKMRPDEAARPPPPPPPPMGEHRGPPGGGPGRHPPGPPRRPLHYFLHFVKFLVGGFMLSIFLLTLHRRHLAKARRSNRRPNAICRFFSARFGLSGHGYGRDGDDEEKSGLVMNQEDVIEEGMQSEIQQLRNAASVVGDIVAAEEGRFVPSAPSSSSSQPTPSELPASYIQPHFAGVDSLPGYRHDMAMNLSGIDNDGDDIELPAYEDNDGTEAASVVQDGFGYMGPGSDYTPSGSETSSLHEVLGAPKN